MRPPWTSRLLLAIDVGERLPAGVADDETGLLLLDRPGRREAARRRYRVRIVRQAGGSGAVIAVGRPVVRPLLYPFDRSSYSRLESTPRRCWHANPRHVVNCIYRVETSEQRAGTAD
jgi:hypothetical protein